ncbi:hypothetical protein RJD24_06205 [Bacillaceae bacterium IKA-2]|nr:hypothetical protein RJD24_06205 [Bacillaceae bacterium IKA-2]
MKQGLMMMKKLILGTFLLFLLTGCLYPEQERLENQVSYENQILAVQQAVVQYRLENQVLPIHQERTDSTKIQQNLIDFQKLVPMYLQQPPGNSFENGGFYQYVLIDVEVDPQVKLIDLAMTREIQEFQRSINEYRRKNRFAPVQEIVAEGVFLLDHEKLRLKKAPTVNSPFHPDHRLPLLMDGDGIVIVDYTISLNDALNQFEHGLVHGDDIRELLVTHYPFVPAYSVPYTIKDGKAVFSSE